MLHNRLRLLLTGTPDALNKTINSDFETLETSITLRPAGDGEIIQFFQY